MKRIAFPESVRHRYAKTQFAFADRPLTGATFGTTTRRNFDAMGHGLNLL